MFNRESLCIVEGRHVWRLCLDIVCLSREGNLTDAAILAAIVALSDVILPATTISKDDKVLLTQGTLQVAAILSHPRAGDDASAPYYTYKYI